MATARIGGNEVALSDLSGRKALRAAKIVRGISAGWPKILTAVAEFRIAYERENFIELDRTTALLRYGPRPELDPETQEIVRHPEGHPKTGEIRMLPGQLDHFTDADWEKSGNKLRLPETPKVGEVVAAAFPTVFDIAEEELTQLLALFLVTNEEFGSAAREGADKATKLLDEKADEMLDKASLAEVMELAVVAAEEIERQVTGALDTLGPRVRHLARMIGLDLQAPADEASGTSEPKPTSSTPSPGSTGGPSETPSTTPDGSSSPPSGSE